MLYRIKNCHCCSSRQVCPCDLKNSEINLLKIPKIEKRTVLTKIERVRVPIQVPVASYCKDFNLEVSVKKS